jgi:hypothetical protein
MRDFWVFCKSSALCVCRRPILFFSVMLSMCFSIYGLIGRSWGVHNLFRDSKNPFDVQFGEESGIAWPFTWLIRLLGSAAFQTQAFAVALVGLMWTIIVLLDRPLRHEPPQPTIIKDSHLLPVVAVLSVAPLLSAVLPTAAQLFSQGDTSPLILILPVLGTIVGLLTYLLFTKLVFFVAHRLNISAIIMVIVFSCAFLILIMLDPLTTGAKLLFIVLAWLVLGYAVFAFMPQGTQFPVMLLVFLILYFGNSIGYKYSFPEMESLYASNNRIPLPLAAPAVGLSLVEPVKAVSEPTSCYPAAGQAPATSQRPIAPLSALQHWRAWLDQLSENEVWRRRKTAPKLLIITASGGAYRASFWTAMVLDSLIQESGKHGTLAGLDTSIRLLTGASGGMLANAYFAVSRDERASQPHAPLVEQIQRDIIESQKIKLPWMSEPRRLDPILGDRDSLTLLAKQLVGKDSLMTILPFRTSIDRGRELENHWRTIREKTFEWLGEGEAAGWRPSLVISPMLAETGQPLLISNLDLSGLREQSYEAVEFFHLFPTVRDRFRISTAVRMNAAFPFVTPAVKLPTNPFVRVVDAAYYDSYGVDLAVAYLQQREIMDWLKRCTSGVILIQIRAFKIGPKTASEQTRLQQAISFLTTPLEGAATARDATMHFRNQQELRLLQRLYDPQFLQTVVFEPDNKAEATMTWDLPEAELNKMRNDLANADHNLAAMSKLKRLWQDN